MTSCPISPNSFNEYSLLHFAHTHTHTCANMIKQITGTSKSQKWMFGSLITLLCSMMPNYTSQIYAHPKLWTSIYEKELWPECLITHITHMDVHQYACVNMLSDGSDHCMPYYKHLKHKSAHHYECVDVLSCCFVDWNT
jgi:hypothetical protein